MSEIKYIDRPGKYDVELLSCQLCESENGKYYLLFSFKTETDLYQYARQYLTSDRSVEFVEKMMRDAFGFADADTIETMTEPARLKALTGTKCRIVCDVEKYESAKGEAKETVKVKFINGINGGAKEAVEDLSGFKARIRAIRAGQVSAPAPKQTARVTPPPASKADLENDDVPF